MDGCFVAWFLDWAVEKERRQRGAAPGRQGARRRDAGCVTRVMVPRYLQVACLFLDRRYLACISTL